jgi:hypothetical protein
MQKFTLGAAAALFVFAAAQATAQMHGHMDMAPDERQQLDFPPMMRAHMLGNMRSHFIALQEILGALAASDGAKAGRIARERLGVESPNAAACVKPKDGGMTAMGDMAAMMAHHMPDEMRALGLTMHESASAFADVAEKLAPGGDVKPALAALAQVTQNCAACHAAYKLR